jgi:hypothetical protein
LFEEALAGVLSSLAQRQGDVFERTGATTGQIRHCKVGDFVVQMGPDSPAAGARIVFEAKEDSKYDLRRALEEMEQARKNRQAGIGVFVFSQKSAPPELEPFSRYGDDLIIVWDAESPASEVNLRAAYSTARALSLRVHRELDEAENSLEQIEQAARAIEKQIRFLEDIRRQAETTKNSGSKILERAERMAGELQSEVERLDEQVAALRQSSQPG